MAHVGQKLALQAGHFFGPLFGRAQLLVRRFQFSRSLCDLLLQLNAILLQLQIALGQPRVLFLQQAFRNGAAHLLADKREGADFFARMRVRFPMMHIDDADGPALVHQRHRQKRLVRVLHQCRKAFEARIGGRVGTKRHHGLMLGNPASYAFAEFHPNVIQILGARNLRRAQHKLASSRFHQVNQAGIASSGLRGQPDDLPQHFIQRQL